MMAEGERGGRAAAAAAAGGGMLGGGAQAGALQGTNAASLPGTVT